MRRYSVSQDREHEVEVGVDFDFVTKQQMADEGMSQKLGLKSLS